MGIQIVANTDTVSKEESYSQIMFEIQKRIVDIESNREQKKPIEKELAEMVVLINKLSETENISESLINDRKPSIEKLLKE